jgi:hypothetical protein
MNARKILDKTGIFVPCVKRQKMSCEIDYFCTNFFLFYTGHKACRFLLKQLCEHVTCQDIHETFYFVFF